MGAFVTDHIRLCVSAPLPDSEDCSKAAQRAAQRAVRVVLASCIGLNCSITVCLNCSVRVVNYLEGILCVARKHTEEGQHAGAMLQHKQCLVKQPVRE